MHAAREPADKDPDLRADGEGQVVVEDGTKELKVKALGGTGGYDIAGHALKALDKGGVTSVSEERGEIVSVLLEV